MKLIPVAIAVIIVGVGTYFEGNWMERWDKQRSAKLDRFTRGVGLVREKLGTFVDSRGQSWQSVEKEIDEKTFKASGCTDCASLQYQNSDGETVDIFLAAGHSRHITIHTPEWCYPGAGFDSEGDPKNVRIACEKLESDPEFLTKVFKKEDPMGAVNLQILWTYTEDGNWRGPRMPKPAYGNRPALFKIYLITQLNQSNDEERLTDFARDYMPQVTQLLFQEVNQTATAADVDAKVSEDDAAPATTSATPG